MEQVFVANPKGGSGKTTISSQLAAYFANQGHKVLLVDHDALKCSSDWLSTRPQNKAQIRSIVASVGAEIDTQDADWVIHDMPAAWTLENVQEILHEGDKVLIPVLSSPNDIKACLRFIMDFHRSGVMECGIRVGLIANRVRSNTKYSETLNGFLEGIDLPILSVLRDTQNYVRAMDAGLTIFDLPPSKNRRDTEQWKPILDWLEKKEIEPA